MDEPPMNELLEDTLRQLREARERLEAAAAELDAEDTRTDATDADDVADAARDLQILANLDVLPDENLVYAVLAIHHLNYTRARGVLKEGLHWELTALYSLLDRLAPEAVAVANAVRDGSAELEWPALPFPQVDASLN